ncbi:MAG: GIY-YIG nuclease family protein [Cyanobacteria bacterium]|nr:GIY-YIG nuclease family protein [Cyanobacteriota bacterium]MDA1020550.1 GIY-YIG nuclease family protein [Cyanobacteriota bacterium]
MKYVYILESRDFNGKFYVGSTYDLKKRLLDHNSKNSGYTQKYTPWQLKNYFAFSSPEKANDFETYLKSSSGRSFSKKHF